MSRIKGIVIKTWPKAKDVSLIVPATLNSETGEVNYAWLNLEDNYWNRMLGDIEVSFETTNGGVDEKNFMICAVCRTHIVKFTSPEGVCSNENCPSNRHA